MAKETTDTWQLECTDSCVTESLCGSTGDGACWSPHHTFSIASKSYQPPLTKSLRAQRRCHIATEVTCLLFSWLKPLQKSSLPLSTVRTSQNGSHEGHEGDEGDEGHEGHEGDEGNEGNESNEVDEEGCWGGGTCDESHEGNKSDEGHESNEGDEVIRSLRWQSLSGLWCSSDIAGRRLCRSIGSGQVV